MSHPDNATRPMTWSRFWFEPSPPDELNWLRRSLCLIVAIYFVSAFGDASFWFAEGAPASSSQLGDFFRTAELESDARWMLSPLYIWDWLFSGTKLSESALVYRVYLIVGVALALLAGGLDRLIGVSEASSMWSRVLRSPFLMLLLWVWFVGWANRVVLLAGICEPVLSVSLFALSLAPTSGRPSWRTTFSRRLVAMQFTLIACATSATMLAGRVWWNGTGAYALAAPVEDRFFSARNTLFENPLIYEGLTALLVVAIPLGVVFVWQASLRKMGMALVFGWCLVVAILSANVLYAATMAVLATSIKKAAPPDGTIGAKSSRGEGAA